ncbi:hypothetical protein LTR84_002736 [Exophiala bonariae]|uniref:Mitochondrial thiamine pyrophosphate carrier 1 n=1 Tax=Exophiala bonariae TaxID=1690606 RepID=A0AAV9ND76_9EURO|nr:hypothetical protein LTR84_002736 [Exophiala bonariae]
MDSKPTVLVSIAAGAAAGATETFVTYPTEYIKTYRQLPPPTSSAGSLETYRPKTNIQVLRDTLRASGPRGLYSGCSALAVSNAAKGGIRFISFTQSQAWLRKTTFGKTNPGWSNALAGLAAGATESILVVTPGEALKTKIIHDQSAVGVSRLGLERLNLAQAAMRVAKMDGVRALWSGLGPVLCKQGTNSAVRFATFGWVLDNIRQTWKMDGVGATVMAGAVSGVVTTYASMPFDNIKTRMQSLDSTKSVGMFRLAFSMLRMEGPLVFWRATTPRLMRLTMSSAITFTVFNQIVELAAGLKEQPWASGAKTEI